MKISEHVLYIFFVVILKQERDGTEKRRKQNGRYKGIWTCNPIESSFMLTTNDYSN